MFCFSPKYSKNIVIFLSFIVSPDESLLTLRSPTGASLVGGNSSLITVPEDLPNPNPPVNTETTKRPNITKVAIFQRVNLLSVIEPPSFEWCPCWLLSIY